MTKQPGWQQHEHDVAAMFGLDLTVSSGNRFHDPGDAIHRGRRFPFPVYAEAKYTSNASRSLRLAELQDGQERAEEIGRRFILPLRFWPRGAVGPHDYVVLNAHDLAELLDMVNERTP